jgi:hypothetical protein
LLRAAQIAAAGPLGFGFPQVRLSTEVHAPKAAAAPGLQPAVPDLPSPAVPLAEFVAAQHQAEAEPEPVRELLPVAPLLVLEPEIPAQDPPTLTLPVVDPFLRPYAPQPESVLPPVTSPRPPVDHQTMHAGPVLAELRAQDPDPSAWVVRWMSSAPDEATAMRRVKEMYDARAPFEIISAGLWAFVATHAPEKVGGAA